jgi:hypothetical protein
VTRTARGEALGMINPEKPLRAEVPSAAGKNTMFSVIFRFLRSGRDPQYFPILSAWVLDMSIATGQCPLSRVRTRNPQLGTKPWRRVDRLAQ